MMFPASLLNVPRFSFPVTSYRPSSQKFRMPICTRSLGSWRWKRRGEFALSPCLFVHRSQCHFVGVIQPSRTPFAPSLLTIFHPSIEKRGPKIPFRLGRIDAESGETSPKECGLPDADKGSRKGTAQHVRDVFYREFKVSRVFLLVCRPLVLFHPSLSLVLFLPGTCVIKGMGFSDKEIVALLGAHALGRCHTDRSGYWGPWTFAENAFSNEYFRLLVEERWSPKVSHNGKPWEGPDQFEDSTGKLMMLPR